MAEIRVGIIGGGWPGQTLVSALATAGGFKIVAVADLIPARRKKIVEQFSARQEYETGEELIKDVGVDAVCVGVPNDLHAPITLAALRAGKHVLCETPPAVTSSEAKRMDSAAAKAQRVLMYGLQRRFSPHAQAASQAIAKGYAGEIYHARASWTRTRGIPQGTGWYTQKNHAGGGVLYDLGIHMLDLAWHLLGEPKPKSATAITHQRLAGPILSPHPVDVEETALALLTFEGNKSLELSASWAINQPPAQNGSVCRLYGDAGAIEVFTPRGAVLYRDFKPTGECKEHLLKGPKTAHHAALARHFKGAIQGKHTPTPGGPQGIQLMKMLEALQKSAATGKTVGL
jgi:predicted dehydrogenase